MNWIIYSGLGLVAVGTYIYFTKKRELPKDTKKYDDL